MLIERYLFDPAHVTELYDAQATRQRIYRAFEHLGDISGQDDSLLIYYAGHGQNSNGMGYWIPYDGRTDFADKHTWIPHDEIRRLIKALGEIRHVLLVSDSCFAGDFVFGHRGSLESGLPRDMKEIYHMASRRIMTSGGIEPVKDLGLDEEHSIFAHFFLRALKENRRRHLAPSSRFFFGYITEGLAANRLGSEQNPAYGVLQDTGGTTTGEFVFFLKPSECDPDMDTGIPMETEVAVAGAAPKPPGTVSVQFSNPGRGRLTINNRIYSLAEQPLVHLRKGRHPFKLLIPGQRRIYGAITVHTIDEETELAVFGISDGIFFRDEHIRGALQGRPVRYTVDFTGERGTRTAVSYVLTLLPM